MFRWLSLSLIVVAAGVASRDEPPGKKDAAPTTQPAESQPASTATPAPTSAKPTQARIYEQLLRDTQRARQPIMSVNPDRPQETPAERASAEEGTLLEGSMLIEIIGRLIRHGDRSEFEFPQGSLAAGAPNTMEFNKNGLLEAMEHEYETGVTKFVISAEVARYRGRNYLTLMKYRRGTDHGNLSP